MSHAEVELTSGVPFLSDGDPEAALDEANIRPAVVDGNADARIDGFRAGLAVDALSTLAVIAARRLPTVQPNDPYFAESHVTAEHGFTELGLLTEAGRTVNGVRQSCIRAPPQNEPPALRHPRRRWASATATDPPALHALTAVSAGWRGETYGSVSYPDESTTMPTARVLDPRFDSGAYPPFGPAASRC